MPTIHPSASVDSTAQLSDEVIVGPQAVIEADTVIGSGCRLGPGAVIMRYTTLGAGCTVHAHAVLGDIPQDLEFADADSRVEIGPGGVFREGVTIHRGTKPGSATQVGERCFLMANSHLAHNVVLGDEVIIANGALLGGYVEVGDQAFISGNGAIHQFCRIGRLAMLGGMAGIGKDVPPFCTAASHRRNRIAGLNTIGLRRAGFTPAERSEIKQAYKWLYGGDVSTSEAVERICSEYPSGPARELADFVAGSKRGICAPGD